MPSLPIPPSPTPDDDIDQSGGFTLIDAISLGAAMTIITPTAKAPSRQLVYVVVGTISSTTTIFSLVVGGLEVFQQSILPKSGLNTILSWEEFREPAGPIQCFASVTNVLSYKVSSRWD